VFLAVCGIRLLGLMPAGPLNRPPSLSDDELPVYTVLVPLFRETTVLDQLVAALSRLDYPALCINYRMRPRAAGGQP
jgi:cellulose synthase/poly-beta-1,6-N-acetylglucosamine synthase-like glycosyltransferase